MTNLIEAHNLVKEYQLDKKTTLKALGPVSFTIPKGSFTIIVGRSGSGKSTLLNLLTGLDKPSSGQLKVLGKDISKLNRKALAKYRSQIGIIFQQYNLIPDLTAIENVILGSWAGGSNAKLTTALELLDKFQLRHRAWANVVTLSGGEKQRVAVCRALINQPQILFCDEPTGALDRKNEENVKTILQQLHQEGMTIVLVTHNLDFLSLGTQILELDDGLLVTSRHKLTQL
jgi:ABC-type antimicrobial peptide transport system, ATPase component